MGTFVKFEPRDMADQWLEIVTKLSIAYIEANGHTPGVDEKIRLGELGDDIIKGYLERVNKEPEPVK